MLCNNSLLKDNYTKIKKNIIVKEDNIYKILVEVFIVT
ncbi:hypothetical protein MIDIC_230012 [Alphaproteobacteria bacterium]